MVVRHFDDGLADTNARVKDKSVTTKVENDRIVTAAEGCEKARPPIPLGLLYTFFQLLRYYFSNTSS
jgi:hypothetical protein